jgi:hypothetical protein
VKTALKNPTRKQKRLGWHLIKKNGHFRGNYSDHRVAQVGVPMEAGGFNKAHYSKPSVCHFGMHAAPSIQNVMWKDSPDMTLCLVLVEGDITDDGGDHGSGDICKISGQKRTILFTADWSWCKTLMEKNDWNYPQLERHLLNRFGLEKL